MTSAKHKHERSPQFTMSPNETNKTIIYVTTKKQSQQVQHLRITFTKLQF